MSRKPINVLIFPYFTDKNNKKKFALFKRADMKIWQGISGGVEGEETLLEATRRECYEEARINKSNQFIQLDSISSIPRHAFNHKWDENIFVVKEYSFGVRVDNLNLKISSEHTEYKWSEYSDAKNLLKFDSNKTALWELHVRLKSK